VEESKKIIIIYSIFFVSMIILFLPLELFVPDDPFQKVIIAPLGEEPLKFFAVIFLYLKKRSQYDPSDFGRSLIKISLLAGIAIGALEFILGFQNNGVGAFRNLIGHTSYALLSAIPMYFCLIKVKYPAKYLGFFSIAIGMFFHSIYNQYANISVVTKKNSYLVFIAKFLEENTLLKTQWDFTILTSLIALVLVLFYLWNRKILTLKLFSPSDR